MTNPLPKVNLSLEPPCILVVDDDIRMAQAIARDLRGLAEVQIFTNPLEALEYLKTHSCSIILSDLKMPELDGVHFFIKCQEIQPQSLRILITAFSDLVDISSTINKAHVFSLMTKPWESIDLQKCVRDGLRIYQYASENEELRKLVWTDALTGVANHRYFWERLESEFSRSKRFDRTLSLMMIDVDDFKKFNDRHGHQEGDRVLRNVAQCLENNKRSMDTVARYGGEEFAVILPEVTHELAIDIAKRHLKKTFEQTQISVSIGVATYPMDAQTTTELVHAADMALLKAKSLGKHRVIVANSGIQEN